MPGIPRRYRLRLLLVTVGWLVAAGASAGAQTARPLVSLRVGDTVRVWTSSPAEQVGVVAATTPDTLAIRRLDGRPLSVSLASLSHLDVQRGSKRSPAIITLGIVGGAAVGMITGAFAGAAIEETGDCNGDLCGLAGFVLGGGVGAITGGIVGGILGAKYRTRRWEQLYP